MNPPPYTNPISTPSSGQQPMSEAQISLNQLQNVLQLFALVGQNPLGSINLPANTLGSAPLPSSANPQPPQFQPTPQILPAQGAPNLLSLLGGHGETLGAPLQGALNGAGTAVGSCDNDEELLVQALRESSSKGSTYRHALDSLHGVNNHTAAQWKDYYLDHTPRINKRLSLQNGDRPVVAKKPMLDSKPRHNGAAQLERRPSTSKQSLSRNDSVLHRHSISRIYGSPVIVKQEKFIKQEKTEKRQQTSHKGKGREVPSRTPSPPRNPVMRGRNNYYAFTDEDRQFLIKYATYRLNEDPHLKKLDIGAELAQKAPHHTANSWLSHWSNQSDYYDQYIPPMNRSRRGAEVSGSESEDDDEGSSYSSGEETDEDEDVQDMSGPGELVNDADKRVIARYIASVGSEWNSLRGKERWEPVESMYPQRNYKAWMELYRNHGKAIDELVGKYRRRNMPRHSAVQSQKAVPSWAKRNGGPSSGKKRARSDDDYDKEPSSSRSKRRSITDGESSS